MFNRFPLSTNNVELPLDNVNLFNEPDQISSVCSNQINKSINQHPLLPSQSLEVNYQTKARLNLDPEFLIICITLLLILLAIVGFVGYWVMTNSDKDKPHNSKSNKRRERFLTMFLCGFGILTAIVIFFMFYLIVCY